MRIKREAHKVVEIFASAIATAYTNGPDDLRQAAEYIRTPMFSGNDDERATITAFAELLERKAEKQERLLRKAYGER